MEFPVKDTSSQSDDGLREQLLQAEKMLSPGFHAVCFVIDPNKFSEVKDHFIEIMKYIGDEASDSELLLIRPGNPSKQGSVSRKNSKAQLPFFSFSGNLNT